MVRRQCDVSGCPSHISKVPLHTFPKKPERALVWREFCRNSRLSEIPINKLFMKASICRKHFSREQFRTSACLRLNFNAVPSLLLPSFLLSPTSVKTESGADGREDVVRTPTATVIPTTSSPLDLMRAGSSQPSLFSQSVRKTPNIEELPALSNRNGIVQTSRSEPTVSSPSVNNFEELRSTLTLEELVSDREVFNFCRTMRTLARDKHTSHRDAQEIDSLLFIAASWSHLPGSVRQLLFTRLRALEVGIRYGWVKVEP